MKTSTTAIYARVSTDGQDLSSQLAQCREWCSRHDTDAREFIDKASGGTMDREAFNALMAEIRKGRIKLIVTYKMDRLGRSVVQLAQFIGEMDSLGVAVVCISQGVDTRAANPAGRMQMQMLMVFAEFERSLIKERTNAGIAAAKAKGVVFGRPKGPKVIVPLQSLTAAMATGTSINQFARENGFAPSTLRRALKAS
jgi:DNA invertase Pin-like site-specific DNA recombinase